MNPLRKLWQQAVSRTENLTDGLLDKAEAFVVATKEYNDVTQVHGFYRKVSSDGQTEKGFGFHCPVRGSSDPTEHLKSGAFMTHCGRTDVLDTEGFLPTVQMKPRLGRFQITADGTQAVPTSEFEDFNGEFPYEKSDPGAPSL